MTTDPKATDASFQDLIQSLAAKQEELKEIKRLMKELENDVPMELEDILATLKDLKTQAKDLKTAHLKNIIETSADYVEYREKVQFLKEELVQTKLDLFTKATALSREHGGLNQTVIVEGMPFQLQTQNEWALYLNGKVVK